MVATLGLLLLSASAGAVTPAPLAAPAAPVAAPVAMKLGAVQADVLLLVDDAQKKIMALEDAVPQNKFTWRPMAGVRSISEAFTHIAFANYLMVKIAAGKEPPVEAGWEMNPDKWDKKTTDKAAIKKMLELSFDHVHAVLKTVPDAELDKKVDFFGHEMTARAVWITLVGHLNEHLGQAVAYARSNKIVPPWSRPSKDAAKEMPKDAAKPAAAANEAAKVAAPAPALVPAAAVVKPAAPGMAPAVAAPKPSAVAPANPAAPAPAASVPAKPAK